MECHGTNAQRASDLRWFGREEITQVVWQLTEDRETVEDWLAMTLQPRAPLASWQHPKWWREACEWIAHSLDPNRAGRIVKVTQRRQWDSSCVIHVRCDKAEYFFKAMPESSREREVATFLARHTPALPEIVAVHKEHKWMLMRAFEGRSLEDCGDVARWEGGLASYARLQSQCALMTAELRLLEISTLDMEKLSCDIDTLLSDSAALLEGEPDGLTAAQVDYLRVKSPTLKSTVRRLAAGTIPTTIEHGDLWPGNILVNQTGCAIIDWEDVRLAHPFFSVAPLIAGMDTYQPTMNLPGALDRFREIYIAAFVRFGRPDELRETFSIALPIAMLEIAIRYWHEPPLTVAVNPWMRTAVPYFTSLPYRKLVLNSGWPD
jgi:aminoglycoside phosphotransferase